MKDEIVARADKISPGIPALDDMDYFIDAICCHQVNAAIISQDYSCSMKVAACMAWLGEPYGEREYPLDDDEPVLVRTRTLLEARGVMSPDGSVYDTRTDSVPNTAAPSTSVTTKNVMPPVPARMTRSRGPVAQFPEFQTLKEYTKDTDVHV